MHAPRHTARLLAQHASRAHLPDERGASAVEYSVLVALIAAVIVATVGVLGIEVLGMFNSVDGAF